MTMTDFSSLFMKTKGKPVEYNGDMLHMAHYFPVKEGDILVASIEKASSDCRQGLCIDVTGWCEFDEDEHKTGKGIRMLFWEDTAPKEIKLTVHPTNDRVVIYNIWENISEYVLADQQGNPVTKSSTSVDYWRYGAAMIVEEIEDGFRYRCNDWHPDDDFDDIIFTVRKL